MTLPSPSVSVIMPVYNSEAYLAASVESVLAQTFEDFELLAVDDGSTDASADILASFAARDRRVRIFRKDNSGISETLNVGLSIAQGAWIARIDSDDLMVPSRLGRQLAFIAENPKVAAVGSYYGIVDSAGIYRATRSPLPRTERELKELIARREPLAFTHPTMTFRRDVALGLGGYRRNYEPCEDSDLFARMLRLGRSILIQPEILTHYRVHPNSISSRNAVRMYTMLRFIFCNFYRERDGHPPLSFEQFEETYTRGQFMQRLLWRRDMTWELMMRAHTTASIYGDRVRSLSYLTAAATLRPDRALRRALRALQAKAG